MMTVTKARCAGAVTGMCALLALLTPRSAYAQTPQIMSVREVGSQTDGRRHVELNGQFPSYADSRVEAHCEPAPSMAALVSATQTSLRVSIAEPPSHTRCTFRVSRVTDGAESPWSPTIALADPADEITGIRDRGPSGNRHIVELYGRFPAFATLDVTYGVHCFGRRAASARIDYRNRAQLNISFDDVQEGGYVQVPRCTVVLGYGDGRRTNLWGPFALRRHDVEPLTGFGLYHWQAGAVLNPDVTDTLASGQREVSIHGFDVARFWMTPALRRDDDPIANPYHQNVDLLLAECPVGGPFLPCVARSEWVQRNIGSAHLRIVLLTVADSASTGPYGSDTSFVDPAFFTPANFARVVAEYRDFAIALYETQRNTGKTFIVANWETDNVLMCGSIGDYFLHKDTSQAPCDASRLPPWTRVQGLKLWFAARKEGIAEAQAIARARQLDGVHVADAIEFNSVRTLQHSTCGGTGAVPVQRCPNTLDDLILPINPEYASYSSWESSRDDPPSAPAGVGRMDADLADLKKRFPGTPGSPTLVVGEFGVNFVGAATPTGVIADWAMGQLARAVQRAGLKANIGWSAFDGPGEGLLESDGTPKRAMFVLRQALDDGAFELTQPTTGVINGIVVTKQRVGAQDWDLWEMYGRFPQNPAGTVVTCNGQVDVSLEIIGVTSNRTQMNLRIAHQSRYQDPSYPNASYPYPVWVPRYCVVKVPGILTHGPKIMPE